MLAPLRELSKAQINDFARVSKQDYIKGIKFMALYMSCLDCGVSVSEFLYKQVNGSYDTPSRLIRIYPEAIRYYQKRVTCSRLNVEEKSRLCKDADRGYSIEIKRDNKIERRSSLKATRSKD